MNIQQQHIEMVERLAKDGETIALELNGEEAHLWHMASKLASEAGELVDAVCKLVIYRKKLDIENMIEEMGDCEFYMQGIRQKLGITREQVLEANIKKLSIRYGETYSDQAAQERKDKQE